MKNTMITDYQLNRREQIRKYLNSLKEEAKRINGDESVIFLAQDFLTLLTHKLGQKNLVLEVPDCCPNTGSQGEFHVMFVWTKDEHYLECEIFNNGDIEFFYRNRLIPSECWGENILSDEFSERVSDELVEKLSLFVE